MRSCLAATQNIFFNEVVGFADWRRPDVLPIFRWADRQTQHPFQLPETRRGKSQKRQSKGLGFVGTQRGFARAGVRAEL